MTHAAQEVQRAVAAVPRAVFLPPEQRSHVAEDRPLPIGHHQTISQPSLVMRMTQELGLAPGDRVLEIGTGCGYQTAILAELAHEVFTVERIPELAFAAQQRLATLGYGNIRFRVGDGAQGWPEFAPFAAIIVTAAPVSVPPALVAQLAVGGRMVIPVGEDRDQQVLLKVRRRDDGTVTQEELFGVRFVPLIEGR